MEFLTFMDAKTYTPILLITLVFIAIIYKFTKFLKWRKTLNKIPGPPGLPILGNLFDIVCTSDVLFSRLHNFSNTFYPIFKINLGPETSIQTRSPDDIELIVSGMKHLGKSRTYDPLQPWLKEGLLTSQGAKWQERRKLLTPAFHFSILSQFANIFIEESEKLVKDIQKVTNKPTNVLPIVTKFTLQSICETAMGTRLDEGKAAEKYRDAIYKMGELVINRVITPWYHYMSLYVFTRHYWESRSILKYLHNFTMNVIKGREKNFVDPSKLQNNENDGFQSKRRMAMLDLLLSAKLNGANIDDPGIQEEVDTFMFEGHDTTATSISFSLMLLACNQEIQEKVCEELRDIFGDSDRQMITDDLNDMKYLERVIKESLRLYPSVGLIGRVTSETITTPSGYTIPENTIVMIGIYDLHHDERLYENPEKFDPDRFLQENCKGRHPYAYIPFSAGPRNCIGQKFAMLEMKAVIATILRNFELHPVDTPDTITLHVDLILRTSYGIKIEFKPRKKCTL